MSNVSNITPQAKLSEIVAANPALLSVLERLNIELGFGDATVSEICSKYGFSLQLFTNICSIYANKALAPQKEQMGSEDILHLVEYLLTSHKYYSKKLLPKIHKKIHKLLEGGDEANSQIINKFYDDYYLEVINHFHFEEKTVFPYIRQLISRGRGRRMPLKITQFQENHSNIEDKLSDLRNIILKYLPAEYPQAIRFEILGDIFQLQRDLLRHTLIEDKLLIPAVLRLENE